MAERKASSKADGVQTISRAARRFGLSRSTLLYYDAIGLLKPSYRTSNGYRKYSTADIERLERICTYRKAGLTLDDIGRVLDSGPSELEEVLAQRLESLNGEIAALREQQRFILGIVRGDAYRRVGVMSKGTWVKLLAASGFSEADMLRWHAAFEQGAPLQHEAFLRFLCIPNDEIEAIRQRARRQRGARAQARSQAPSEGHEARPMPGIAGNGSAR